VQLERIVEIEGLFLTALSGVAGGSVAVDGGAPYLR
jgi:hypothetical protein